MWSADSAPALTPPVENHGAQFGHCPIALVHEFALDMVLGAHISAMLSRITSRASLAFIAIMLLVVISVFLLLIYLRLAAIEQTLSGLDVCGTSTTPCHTILH
jgi:hypothetical protein